MKREWWKDIKQILETSCLVKMMLACLNPTLVCNELIPTVCETALNMSLHLKIVILIEQCDNRIYQQINKISEYKG